MDFHIGSGLAALTEIGNEAEDLHFYGGRYGILTDKTSPGWQFTLIDSVSRASATPRFASTMPALRSSAIPSATCPSPSISISDYFDQLWVKDCRFENISSAAVIISKEKSPLNEVGFENAVLKDVPVFALFRESGKKVAGKGAIYKVGEFQLRAHRSGRGNDGHDRHESTKRRRLAAMPAPLPPAIPALPPTSDWVNVRTLGVKGDGTTDDTAAIQKAIDQHRVLYFPSGRYLVSDTLALKPDTVLIGLHPTADPVDLAGERAGFQGVGTPMP